MAKVKDPNSRSVAESWYKDSKPKYTISSDSLSLKPESKVVIRVGDVVSDAVYSDGSFKVPEGTLAFSPGSSGWDKNGQPLRWMELFLRGGNAWERFGKPRINQVVTILN